ncbi:MAG TPA: DUF4388 domain-containing protein [Oceanithermus sp.]|nr:DUF4388 domain-containing protein [Oceanithermus sp.]
MFGGSLSGLRPSELLILLKGRDGELLLAAQGEPPVQLYLKDGRVVCAREGAEPLEWRALVERLAALYSAPEVVFLFQRGVRPRRCAILLDRPADRLVLETVELGRG